MGADPATPHILHLHSAFNLGGKEARAIRLMNIWGDRARHSVVSGDPDAMGARSAIRSEVQCDFPGETAPPLRGRPSLSRYRRLARFMAGFDLVLTYNWGAMDAVMAHKLFAPFKRMPPLIHHEDGFNEDEAERLKPQRNLFRRAALARAHALVVPSKRLQNIALSAWHQPARRIYLIPNGIDVPAYATAPQPDAIPGFARTPGKTVIGTVAGLRAVKNLPRLVRAVAPLADKVQLVIVGEGPEHDAIARQASDLGFDGLCLPGFLPEPRKYIGLFDIFALSSDSEQFPISLIEAMAAGLPVVSPAVGDVMDMVAEPNRPLICAKGDETALASGLAELVADPERRHRIGRANRDKAGLCYDEADMVSRYAALYGCAMGRPDALMTR